MIQEIKRSITLEECRFCGRIKKHRDWVFLTKQEIQELKNRIVKKLFDRCPTCARRETTVS
jgi:NMD protein affecting ribosome stability and mRNA decay